MKYACHFRVFAAALSLAVASSTAAAADRYALIVVGAYGGQQYAQKYDGWQTAFVSLFREKFGYPDDHLIALSEAGDGAHKSTRENVRATFADLRKRLRKDDTLVVLLVGHGNASDGETAKFNLVGPDLSAEEWAELVKPIPARLVIVDTAAGSFPFLRKLAAPGRVVITANDSAGQQFETVLPEFLLKAFADPAADVDKNGRISMWEAFLFASAGVKAWYDQHGRLATERPLLDDTGAGVGTDGTNAAGATSMLAKATYLQGDVVPASADAELARLLKRRAELQAEVDLLRIQKPTMTEEQYEAALEKLLTEVARLDQQIRRK